MGKPRPAARTATARSPLPPGPPGPAPLDPAWQALAGRLAAFLAVPGERAVVLEVKGTRLYLQVATGGASGTRAELVSNRFLPKGARHGRDRLRALLELGWSAPTNGPPHDGESYGPGWRPNHFRDFPAPVPWTEVAALLVETLAGALGVAGPDQLEYQALDASHRRIAAPELGLAERAPPAAAAPPAAPPEAPGGAMAQIAGRPQEPRTTRQQVKELLTAEGYRPWTPEEDRPGALYFKSEGQTFAVRTHEGDPAFVQLALGFNLTDGPYEELALLQAAMKAQTAAKVVKAFLPAGGAWVEFQAELFLAGPGLTPHLLDRCLDALRFTASTFFQAIEPETPKAQA